MNIENKTIVLTGASGGIGQAIAHRLSACKANLILAGRDMEKLSRLNEQIGNRHMIVGADLSVSEGRRKLVEFCQKSGPIDILINNAGISHFSAFEDVSEDELIELATINLISPMLLTQSMLPMLSRKSDAIILNVGSSFGAIGYPGYAAYCATKYGLRGFSEALMREFRDHNVKVLYIAPRATNTHMNSKAVNQMNRALGNKTDMPDVVAAAVIKQLVSENNRVMLGWPEKLFLRINGLFPAIIDRAIAKQLPEIRKFIALG